MTPAHKCSAALTACTAGAASTKQHAHAVAQVPPAWALCLLSAEHMQGSHTAHKKGTPRTELLRCVQCARTWNAIIQVTVQVTAEDQGRDLWLRGRR